MSMIKITTRGSCRVKDARSPKRWGVIYIYITGHCSSLCPGLHPGHIDWDRSDLPTRCCRDRGCAAGAAGRVVVTVDFDILTAHRVTHRFNTIRRFLVNDDLLL